MSIECRIVYFDKVGRRNTDETLQIARRRADELGIKKAAIASVTGYTARKAMDVFAGFYVVIVTAHTGWSKPDLQSFPEDLRKELEAKGWPVLTSPHVFGGISYAMRDMFNTAMLGVDLGNTLRILGQGMKVVCEVAMSAADAGLLRTDEEVVSIGGTNVGADTAAILKPVHVHQFFDLRVKEILCKPRL